MKKILARVILEFKPPLFQAWKTETVNRKCEVLEEKDEIIRVKFECGFYWPEVYVERWISKKDILGVIE